MRNEWDYNAWKTLSGGAMKKYLFGLGAMLVGAGLMFVLMHGEVSADGMTVEEFRKKVPQSFYCSDKGRTFEGVKFKGQFPLYHCRINNIMTCAVFSDQSGNSVSCMKWIQQ